MTAPGEGPDAVGADGVAGSAGGTAGGGNGLVARGSTVEQAASARAMTSVKADAGNLRR